jgi:predicted esterase
LAIDCPAPHACLIWCHGNGELAQEYEGMFRRAFSPLNIRVLLPAPPFSQDSQKWFDLEDTDWLKVVTGSVETDRELLILEQIEAGADRVAALVERELLTTKTVYVSGFAQGGCVALYAALTRVRCAGVVSMGGPPVRLDLLKASCASPRRPCASCAGRRTRRFPSPT